MKAEWSTDWSTFWPKVLDATGETVYMVLITLALSTAGGLAVGLTLYASRTCSPWNPE
ncbi:hypothetical protein [Streptomyces avidinii]|uniref:ABC-type methionine transport system permease subunit n=1 Tax=Streptomyces avidinii TaxID=1895 RepID=A0ABS4L6J3_STRAV|nr:hypothetical protein [Streptomyces avidinii]MBP2037704.1 ABC-type methionine transport system permease subunit [Streptomyces avidinii]GGZ09280.1 hypothetical protein GCM10010343_39600 [Streptomyces avidinii]